MMNVAEVTYKRSRKYLKLLALAEKYKEKYGEWPISLETRRRLHYTEQRELYRIERDEAILHVEEQIRIARQKWIVTGGAESLRRKTLAVNLLKRIFGISLGVFDGILNLILIVLLLWAFFYIIWLVIQPYLNMR